MSQIYDVTIIGGGPGGYAAALYCARSNYSTAVIEKLSPGGQMATTGQVDNYPGFVDGVDGFELGEMMQKPFWIGKGRCGYDGFSWIFTHPNKN